jgi:molybdopterin-guanine dinucleotide biosynthesis protein A
MYPNHPVTFSAVLLAGGESRRMGTDKAKFLFRGKPLWQVQFEALRRLRPAEIFVSARTDPSWRPNDVQFIADIPPSLGPLSGLAACLDRVKTTHLLVLAVDMPLMTNEYLQFLCSRIEPARGAVPKIGNRAEPLAAIYPREAALHIGNVLTGSDFSLQSLIGHLVTAGKLLQISVADHDKHLFLNMNEFSNLRVCSQGN